MADPVTSTPPEPPPAPRRDLGTAALVVAAVLALLALTGPVATLRSTDGTVDATATSGWFGDLVSTEGTGTPTVTAGAGPAFGWAVVTGVALLVVAVVLRLRTGRAPAAAVLAAGWLAASGALVGLHTAARASRLRDVLAQVVPGDVSLSGSGGPWLLVAAGVVSAVAALAPRRAARPRRVAPAPLAVWQPVPRDPR